MRDCGNVTHIYTPVRSIMNINCCFFSPSPLRWPGGVMASRLLDRLKRSLFKDGQGAGPEQEAGGIQEEEEFKESDWEAELEEEEECVTDRLGGTLCFDSGGGGGGEDGAEGEGSGLDSDSDFLGESMEEGLSSAGEVELCSFNRVTLMNEHCHSLTCDINSYECSCQIKLHRLVWSCPH